MAGSAASFETDIRFGQQVAEYELAKAVERKLEEHRRRFGEQEMPFSYPNLETLCVPVMQRACRMFWQKNPDLWPRFILSGTGGVSIEFRRIR